MKKYRRVEITAFRRCVTIASGNQFAYKADGQTEAVVCLNDADSAETVELGSEEGKRILNEAIRLLKEKLGMQN